LGKRLLGAQGCCRGQGPCSVGDVSDHSVFSLIGCCNRALDKLVIVTRSTAIVFHRNISLRAMSVATGFSHLRARSFSRRVCQNIVGTVLAFALEPGRPCR
jgi:hypothetical protein